MALSNNEELFFQAYGSIKFLFELQSKDFLHSKYYAENFPPSNELYKFIIEHTGIINSGTILLVFYTLLVFPREAGGIQEETEKAFHYLDTKISEFYPDCESTYKKDIPSIQYTSHIRNAIAHGKAEILDNNDGVRFFDKSRDASFTVTFTWTQINVIANYLQTIVDKMYHKVKDQ